MKRLSKLIAVVAAMVMVMAMSASAFAAESPVVEAPAGTTVEEIAKGTTGDLGEGETAEKAIKDILTEADVKVPAGYDVELLAKMDLESDQKVITFTINDSTLEGKTVYVLHYADNGSWYLYKGDVSNGALKIEFPNGLSPLYFFVVKTTDGVVGTLTLPADYSPTNALKSHKTGY